jgi:hypothetical protein
LHPSGDALRSAHSSMRRDFRAATQTIAGFEAARAISEEPSAK